MQHTDTGTTCEPGASQDPTANLTLNPIRTDGAAVFVTHQIPPITEVALRELEIEGADGSSAATILHFDNIYGHHDATGQIPNPVPTIGILARAVLIFFLRGSRLPHTAELCPPNTIRLQDPADAPVILAWLTASGFRIVQHLARTLTILFLILATASAPVFDDNDGDADDDDANSDRHTLSRSLITDH